MPWGGSLGGRCPSALSTVFLQGKGMKNRPMTALGPSHVTLAILGSLPPLPIFPLWGYYTRCSFYLGSPHSSRFQCAFFREVSSDCPLLTDQPASQSRHLSHLSSAHLGIYLLMVIGLGLLGELCLSWHSRSYPRPRVLPQAFQKALNNIC